DLEFRFSPYDSLKRRPSSHCAGLYLSLISQTSCFHISPCRLLFNSCHLAKRTGPKSFRGDVLPWKANCNKIVVSKELLKYIDTLYPFGKHCSLQTIKYEL